MSATKSKSRLSSGGKFVLKSAAKKRRSRHDKIDLEDSVSSRFVYRRVCYLCTSLCEYARAHVCVCVYACMFMCKNTYACVCTISLCVCMCMYVSVCVRVCVW